jgi:hypothetical protein
MVLYDPFPNPAQIQQNLNYGVNLMSKVIWPALATLVPVALTAVAKWVQGNSRTRRSAELTDRISTLAKSIAELPASPPAAGALAVTPHTALSAELEAVVNELTLLQTRAKRTFTGVTTLTSKLRSALLLYRPKGFLAFVLHVAFFGYMVIFACVVLAVGFPTKEKPASGAASNGTPAAVQQQPAAPAPVPVTEDRVTNVLAFIVVFGVLGIPPLIIRHFAARIHRRQCLASQEKTPPVPGSMAIPVTDSAQATGD